MHLGHKVPPCHSHKSNKAKLSWTHTPLKSWANTYFILRRCFSLVLCHRDGQLRNESLGAKGGRLGLSLLLFRRGASACVASRPFQRYIIFTRTIFLGPITASLLKDIAKFKVLPITCLQQTKTFWPRKLCSPLAWHKCRPWLYPI